MEQKTATSAGAIILREIDGQLKIALARHRREERVWVLPKGHVEPGETLEQAALREVHEEAGLRFVQLLAYLGSFVRESHREEGRVVLRKTIHYYLAYALPSSEPEQPTEEEVFLAAGWFSPTEVLELLPYESDRAFLRERLGMLFM